MRFNVTWQERELPVLQAIVALTDEGAYHIDPGSLAERTEFNENVVNRGLVALAGEQPPYFDFTDTTTFDSHGREIGFVYNPTGHARRAVGTWPTAEALADRIVAGLRDAAEAEEDDQKRTGMKRTAAWLGGAGRDLLVQVTGTVITKSAGM